MEKAKVKYNDEEIELVVKLDEEDYDDTVLFDELDNTIDLTEELSKTMEIKNDID